MNLLHWLHDRIYLCLTKNTHVASVHGVELRSIREPSEKFVEVCSSSIELIKQTDSRQFHRLQRHTRFIANQSLPGGARSGQFNHRINVTILDFEFDPSMGDELTHAAFFAGVIVHETTHGHLRSHGIVTTRENRNRVERICVSEENRFLRKLDRIRPGLGSDLIRPFAPKRWDSAWNDSPLKRTIKHLKRVRDIEAKNRGAKGD